MTFIFRFEVRDSPVPKGSIKFVGMRGKKPILVSTGGYPLIKWSKAVKKGALDAAKRVGLWRFPVVGDVQIVIAFSVDNRRANDIDKLIRGVLDALTGIVYLDDRQVVNVSATKRFVPKEMSGAVITVQAVGNDHGR